MKVSVDEKVIELKCLLLKLERAVRLSRGGLKYWKRLRLGAARSSDVLDCCVAVQKKELVLHVVAERPRDNLLSNLPLTVKTFGSGPLHVSPASFSRHLMNPACACFAVTLQHTCSDNGHRVRVPAAWRKVRSDNRRDDQSEVPCRLEYMNNREDPGVEQGRVLPT